MFFNLVYILLTEIVFILAYPFLYFLFRNSPQISRLGKVYPEKTYDMLIFAASVGEINGIIQLLLAISESESNFKILLLTNTITGYKLARNLHPRIEVMVSPLDIFHLRLMQFKGNKPKLILITETEIWPMLLFTASLMCIPILFINARMSGSTQRKYLKIKNMLTSAGRSIKKICAQTDKDCQRFSSIFPCNCESMGNLKYSIQLPVYDTISVRTKHGYLPEDYIIVVGSSRPGEEELIYQCYRLLNKNIKGLKLVIVPRHLKRINDIRKIFTEKEVSFHTEKSGVKDIHVIDEMGLLPLFYSICDIAVIGGSFFPFGGHNPLEAAFYGKKIIIGPYHSSCQGSVDDLINSNAILISNKDTLCQDIQNLINNPDCNMGERARAVVKENSQSLEKHLKVISSYINLNE